MSSLGISRRRMLELAAAAGGLAGLQGYASVVLAAGQELTSLRSTAKSWLWSPEDFAIAEGFFDKSGLKVTMAATNRGTNHDALLSGAADVLLGAPTQTMRVQVRHQPVKILAGFVNKFASNVVVRKDLAERAGVTEASPVDAKAKVLKGLRMGTTGPGAGPDQLLRWLMRRVQIDPDRDAQLTPIQGGGQGMLAALKNGQIDGFCLSSPTSDIACEKFGAAYLFNMATNPPPELADYLYICASVTEDTLKKKRPELVSYCRGIALALKAIHDDKARFQTWAKGYFEGMDPKLFDVSFVNNVGIYMKTPVPTEAQFKSNLEFLRWELKTLGQPEVPSSFGFKDAFDLGPVQEAMAKT